MNARNRRSAPPQAPGASALLVSALACLSCGSPPGACAAEPKPLLFLGDKDYPPITYLDDGEAKGLDVDLANAVARRMSRPIRVELMDWEAAQAKVLAGQADGLLAMAITDERRQLFDFADPAFMREFGLFVRTSGSTLRGLADLPGRRVGVTAGGLPRTLLHIQPGLNLVLIKNYKDGFDRLAERTLDVVAADLWVGAYILQAEGIRGITIAGPPFARIPSALAVKRGNLGLLREVNAALGALKDAGTLAEIQNRWRPEEILFLPRARVRVILLYGACAILLLLFGSMAGWVLALKRQIRIRRRTESAMLESEARYRALAEQAPNGIAVWVDDKMVYANQATANMLGAKSPSELLGRPIWDFIEPDAHELIRQRRTQMLKSGEPVPALVGRVRRLDGTPLEIEAGGAPITYAGKAAIQNSFIDITAQRRAVEALERRMAFEELFNGLLSGFSQATSAEMEGHIRQSLQSIAQFLGADYAFADQIAEQANTWSCTHEWCRTTLPSKQNRYQNVPLGTSPWIEQRLKAGEVVQINRLADFPSEAEAERRAHSAEGIKSSLHVPLLGRGGLVRGCVGLLSVSREVAWGADDVRWLKVLSDTIANALERKRVERALQESEERYRALAEHAPHGIVVSVDDRVVYANPAAAGIVSAATPADLVGRSLWDFPSEEAHAQIRDRRQRMLATGLPAPVIDLRVRRLDGKVIDVQGAGAPIIFDGSPAIQNTFVDITERKKAEEHLKQSREQLRALSSRLQSLREEERTRIAREIHDHLGQLLTALKFDLRSLERKIVDHRDIELRGALQAKISSARELADEMIASVQKIASELRPGILDRLGLAAAIEVETQAFQSRTGIRCRWTAPTTPLDAAPELATAAFRIFQEVLTNVARHARATEVTVRLGQHEDQLVLEVSDNGAGLRTSDLENPKSLGLLGMQERAAILGGTVSFGPPAGRGTFVTVQLPLHGELHPSA